MLQRRASGGEAVNDVPPVVRDVLGSSGQPLDAATRAYIEPRFRHDFSGVRVHTDARAAESARAVNAMAYTVGRDVVFGAGRYEPYSRSGRQLLAHELAHVVQQSQSAASVQSASLVDSPESEAESEAESVGQKVLAGEPFTIARARPASRLQRKILNKVETNFQPDAKGAKACVVHLHGEEHTALAVAKEIRSRRCVNLVHLDTYTNPAGLQRYVKLEIDVGGKKHVCHADPNRVFTEAGLKSNALADKGCHLADDPSKQTDKLPDVRQKAIDELRTFATKEWGSKISECRAGSGSSPSEGTLSVLALHNNEQGTKDGVKVPLLDSYKSVAEKGARLPQDPNDAGKKAANPLVKPGEDMNDFFLVTKPQDFTGLSARGTVFLQADPIPAGGDDGSLSVVLAQQRFINVEKRGRGKEKPLDKGNKFQAHDAVYVKNYAMAADALDQLGVPDGPCVVPDAEDELHMIEGAPNAWIRNRLGPGKSNEPTLTLSTDAPVLDRDPVPQTKPANCRFFENQSELDAERLAWKQKIERMPLMEIVNWIIGGPKGVPAGVEALVKQQRECMTAAMTKTLAAKKMKLPGGTIITSEQRTFAKQETSIWKKKVDFTFPTPFGHITDEARKKCGTNIKATEHEWNPKNKEHEKCWKTTLTGEEQEKEILVTSSAPGVSRHHAGTDFDFGRPGVDKDLEQEAWTGTGDFADAYRWLARNASRYGFIQPFDTEGGPGKGYMTERWHWSYYPIAQALLEFAFAHQKEIDDALQTHWTDGGAVKPEYRYISANWRKYMFNVENRGRF